MTKRMLIMIGGILILVLILAGGFFLHIKTLMASAPKRPPGRPGWPTPSRTCQPPAARSAGRA